MISQTKYLKVISCILIVSIISGCGGVYTKTIPDCIDETAIYSTPDVKFSTIKDESFYNSYSSLKVRRNDLFLCFHEMGGSCSDLEYLGFMTTKLPENITITFDGLAKKTRKWGINTISTGPAPTIHFRGHFYKQNKTQTVWVTGHTLKWMFESQSDFKEKNSDAYNSLVLNQMRLTKPKTTAIVTSSNESPHQRSNIVRREFSNWNCRLKPAINTETDYPKRKPGTLSRPLNLGIEVLDWMNEACRLNAPCLNRSFTRLKNNNPVTIAVTGASISDSSQWKLLQPDAFEINVPPGSTVTVGKELVSAAIVPPDGGEIKLTLNDGSVFKTH